MNQRRKLSDGAAERAAAAEIARERSRQAPSESGGIPSAVVPLDDRAAHHAFREVLVAALGQVRGWTRERSISFLETHERRWERRAGGMANRGALLLEALEARFPEAHHPLLSSPPETAYLAAIDALLERQANAREGAAPLSEGE